MSNKIQEVKKDVVAGFQSKESFELLQRLGQFFASSSLVPKEYQGNVADCIIACNMAIRMNTDPLMVMQNLDTIYGRPAWRSKFLIGSINSCGKFEPLRFRFEKGKNLKGLEYTEYVWNPQTKKKESVLMKFKEDLQNISCVAFSSKKGSDEILEGSSVTLEMAIKEGWYTKAGSKWQTMPEQMLRYRASSFWISAYAPEISLGMMTTDEARDIEEAEVINIQTNTKESVRNIIEEDGNKIDFETGEIIDKSSSVQESKKEQINDGGIRKKPKGLF